MPVKAGGGAKQNVSVEQVIYVSIATHRAATTTRQRHTEKTHWKYLPTSVLSETSQEGGKGEVQTAAQMHDL